MRQVVVCRLRVGEGAGGSAYRGVVVSDAGDAGRPLGVVDGDSREQQVLLDREVTAALLVEEALEASDRLDDRRIVGAAQSQCCVEGVLVVAGERRQRRRALHAISSLSVVP